MQGGSSLKRQFTTEQLLTRFEDRREIINLMARYAADYLLKKERTMFANYWSTREDVTRGVNDGYYVGAQAVAGYYAALDAKNALVAKLIQKKFPEQLGQVPDEKLYGVGTIGYKPLDTGVIEIAADGQTAKGIWCLRGSYSDLTVQGVVSYWVWGWIACDFVWEDEAWKIWHMQEVYDINNPCGTSWAAGPADPGYPEEPVFAPMADFHMPEPNLKKPLRAYYTTTRPATPSPEVPQPYETFDETFSYGV
jgi:hypothetical protein